MNCSNSLGLVVRRRLKFISYGLLHHWVCYKMKYSITNCCKNSSTSNSTRKNEKIILAMLDWISFLHIFQDCNSFTWIISNLNFIAFLTRISNLRMRKLCQFYAYKAKYIGMKEQTSKPAIQHIDHCILPLISILREWKFDLKACKKNNMWHIMGVCKSKYVSNNLITFQ